LVIATGPGSELPSGELFQRLNKPEKATKMAHKNKRREMEKQNALRWDTSTT